MAVEASAEPMLDLAFVGGRAIWLPGENTEEGPNKVQNSERRPSAICCYFGIYAAQWRGI